ncbi:hypothetical protein [Aequorivita marina]|uniref:hypothetical protein n=1 Tax=Aequorivita marina TaxID=3073654 RepID=UPI0028763BFE|nr:hypothetical protein [Aequorivita sp. S2608]MDS1296995.1 hypothetical protein [Aequorivita sp. S2608]
MSKKKRKKLYKRNKKDKIVKSNFTTKDKIVWVMVLIVIAFFFGFVLLLKFLKYFISI